MAYHDEHELTLAPLPGTEWRPAGPVGDRSGELSLEPLPGSMEALLADAREWLIECFPEQEDEIREANEHTIRQNVERHYDGGWSSFRHCNG
jgi:hypothetical protein